jgi:hypothetical protein
MRWWRIAALAVCGALVLWQMPGASAGGRGPNARPLWPVCGRWTNTAAPAVEGDGSYFDVEVLDPWHAYALGARLTVNDQYRRPIASRWDGWRWSAMPVPAGGTDVTDMAAVSPTEIWAVGEHKVRIGGDRHWRPAAWRFDGARWTEVRVPSPGYGDSAFNAVTVIPGTRQLWAVGAHYASVGGWPSRPSPLAMRWDGRRWRQAAMPELQRAAILFDVAAIDRRTIWAVGTTMWPWQVDGGASLIVRNSGGHWRVVRAPDIGVLDEIAGGRTRDALAAGRGSGVLRWNGDRWSKIPKSRLHGSGRLEVSGVAFSTAGDAWLAGNLRRGQNPDDPTSFVPVTYRRTSSGWIRTAVARVGSPISVSAIDAATPHDVWVVGNVGVFGGSVNDPVDAVPIAQHWC